jgi:WD40 repeat protein
MNGLRLTLLLCLIALMPAAARAQDGLFDRPILRLDPGVHSAPIRRADVDAVGRWVVTGSHDRTLRIWSADTGAMERMIPIPLGPGNVGKIFAVAISPDGATIAAGGWTRTGNEQIYLFERASGRMLRRIGGLPDVVTHLVFSPNGGALLATLFAGGIRLLKTATGEEIARDNAYDGQSYGAAFARDGRFVTAGYDGALRLYAANGTLLHRAESGHDRPFGVAIHPSGDRVAVGFDDATDVRVFSLSGDRLRPLRDADTSGVTGGNLGNVAWSRDGATLFAGGRYDEDGASPALAWAEGGRGVRRSIAAGRNTIMSLVPLQGSDLLIAGGGPVAWARDGDGRAGLDQSPGAGGFSRPTRGTVPIRRRRSGRVRI